MQVKKKKKLKVRAIFQLHLPCNTAKNDSIIGPTFGQYGIKGIDFCNKFNQFTTSLNYKDNLVLKTIVIVYKDRSFDFYLKTSPLYFLLDQISNENVISYRDLYKVLLIKKKDIMFLDLKKMYKNMSHTLQRYSYEIQ